MKRRADIVGQISEKVTAGYKTIETGVVTGYKTIERGAVRGFDAVTDKCVATLFPKEGETVKDAKKRLLGEPRL